MDCIYLEKKKFDFIFVYQPSPITVGLTGILFKYFKRCKVALWINDLWPDTIDHVNSYLLRKTKFIFRIITNFIYSHSDYILIQSKSFKKMIKPEFRKKISPQLGLEPTKMRQDLKKSMKIKAWQ